MRKPRTFFDKIWGEHIIADLGDDYQLMQIDRLLLHELSGSSALAMLENAGRSPASPHQIYCMVDHLISSLPGRRPDDTGDRGGADIIRAYRQNAAKYGLRMFDVGDRRQGIAHVVSPETGIALPGLTLVCGDSHTCTVGGVGALGWGIGSTECEHVIATQTLVQKRPKTMRVTFTGAPSPAVYPKDMVLHLIGAIGANGGNGHAVEFAGPAIEAMPIEGRLTICNMAIEFSAKYGVIAPDNATFDYLKDREFAPKGDAWDRAVDYWRSLRSDDDAAFDSEIVIDCSEIAPQITWGTSPQDVIAINGIVPDPAHAQDSTHKAAIEKALNYIRLSPGSPIKGVPIDAAYIGSCTNARISDLRIAAEILKGRKVAPNVRAICVPGSTEVKRQAEAEGIAEIFMAAGFEWHESGCAMCSSGGGPVFNDQRVISTTNRNFEGRQGRNTRTHLASPATVAASAIRGHIADAREAGR